VLIFKHIANLGISKSGSQNFNTQAKYDLENNLQKSSNLLAPSYYYYYKKANFYVFFRRK